MSGRPEKLNPDVHAKLVEALRKGNFVKTACAYAGISVSTYYRWLERGEREEEGPYRDLLDDVRHAEAEPEMLLVEIAYELALKDPKWAQWWLTHRYRHWRDGVDRSESEAPASEAEPPDLSRLSDEELELWKRLNAKVYDGV